MKYILNLFFAAATESAVLYFFSNNNTIQITRIGFTPAS